MIALKKLAEEFFIVSLIEVSIMGVFFLLKQLKFVFLYEMMHFNGMLAVHVVYRNKEIFFGILVNGVSIFIKNFLEPVKFSKLYIKNFKLLISRNSTRAPFFLTRNKAVDVFNSIF